MKILVFGARGMLGTDLMNVLQNHNPIGLDLAEVDITKEKLVQKKLIELKPDIVINCAAYTRVDDCEKNQDLAMQVNGQAVGYIAKACQEIGATLIHFSTDYVFDGKKEEGYNEDDQPNPLNIYGKSKLLGEELLQKNCEKFYLIRTSWLYGKNGPNFVETMLKLAKEQNVLKVVNNQFGKPAYSMDLARAVKNIIETKPAFGIYHLTNENSCSWYEFAKKIFEIKNIDVQIEPVTTSEFPRPAKRPNYSILINNKLPKLQPWQEALQVYLKTNV
jgi:dTDP-4-dehydrorhamnose reductase